MFYFQGITTNVTIETKIISDWKMIPIPLLNASKLNKALNQTRKKGKNSVDRMAFFKGSFYVPDDPIPPKDTFLRLDGWVKVN